MIESFAGCAARLNCKWELGPRSLYVLYCKRRKKRSEKFDVVYVGMTTYVRKYAADLDLTTGRRAIFGPTSLPSRFGTIFAVKRSMN